MKKNQKIDCSVHDCFYCDCDNDACDKKEIKVCSCDSNEKKEATMCDSYKRKED